MARPSGAEVAWVTVWIKATRVVSGDIYDLDNVQHDLYFDEGAHAGITVGVAAAAEADAVKPALEADQVLVGDVLVDAATAWGSLVVDTERRKALSRRAGVVDRALLAAEKAIIMLKASLDALVASSSVDDAEFQNVIGTLATAADLTALAHRVTATERVANAAVTMQQLQDRTPDASETVKGLVKLANQAKLLALNDDTLAISPRRLRDLVATESRLGLTEYASQGEMQRTADPRRATSQGCLPRPAAHGPARGHQSRRAHQDRDRRHRQGRHRHRAGHDRRRRPRPRRRALPGHSLARRHASGPDGRGARRLSVGPRHAPQRHDVPRRRAGLPAPSAALYGLGQNDKVYEIDVATRAASEVDILGWPSDIVAIDGTGGLLYGVSTTRLYAYYGHVLRDVGPLGIAVPGSTDGYAFAVVGNTGYLYPGAVGKAAEIDLTTGAATVLPSSLGVAFGGSGASSGSAGASLDGQPYLADTRYDNLVSLANNGAGTVVGSTATLTSSSGDQIGMAGHLGTLYLVAPNTLYTVDTSTGSATSLGGISGLSTTLRGLASAGLVSFTGDRAETETLWLASDVLGVVGVR